MDNGLNTNAVSLTITDRARGPQIVLTRLQASE